MRYLICGDRKWIDKEPIAKFLRELGDEDPIIIEGEAKGADSIARDEAIKLGYQVLKFPANWKRYGKAAGPIRNRQMLIEGKSDLVVAFHSNIKHSKGTKNMLMQAKLMGIPTKLITE